MLKPNHLILILFLLVSLSGYSQYRYTYLGMGIRKAMQDDYPGAIEYFNHYIKDHPGQYDGYYYRGITKYYLNDMVGAERDFDRAIEILPEFPDLYLIRGIVRSERMNLTGAIEDYNYGLVLDSALADLYYYRALVLMDLHRYEEALEDCNRVIALKDDFSRVRLFRGVVYAYLEEYENAIADFNIEISVNPKNDFAYIQRGDAYMKLDQPDSAMLDFEKALSIDSTNPLAYFQRGLARMELNEYEDAVADLNKVLELSPDNELAMFNRALLMTNTDNPEGALADYNQLLQKNPDNMLVFYNLGITWYNLGNYQAAIQSFSKAIEVYPEYAEAYQKRSLAREFVGDFDGADSDKEQYEAIREKYRDVNDTIKEEKSIELMKKTHLAADFTSPREKQGKLQYREIEIQMKPICQLTFYPDLNPDIFAFQLGDKSMKKKNTLTLVVGSDSMSANLIMTEIERLEQIDHESTEDLEKFLQRGSLYLASKNYMKALRDFEFVLSKDTENFKALFCKVNTELLFLESSYFNSDGSGNYTSNLLWIENNIQPIIDQYTKILEQEPDFYYAQYNRGYTYFLLQLYEQAQADFTVVNQNLELAASYYNEGLLSILLAQTYRGCKALSKSGELGILDAYPVIHKYCKE